MFDFQVSPSGALNLTAAIASVGVIHSSLEVLCSLEDYRRGGIFDSVSKPPTDRLRRWVSSVLLSKWRRPNLVPEAAVLRIVAAVLMGTPGTPVGARAAGAVVCILLGEVLSRHTDSGAEWGEVMFRIVAGGAALGWIGGSASTTSWALWFIAAQLSLSYCASGWFKLFEPTWRSGEALWTILAMDSGGHPSLGHWLRIHPHVSMALSWATIAWEVTFVAALFMPQSLLLVILAAGVAFHLSCAFAMGLNTYVLPYVSAYPATLVANEAIRRFWQA